MWKMIHKRWLSLLVFGADMVTRFALQVTSVYGIFIKKKFRKMQ